MLSLQSGRFLIRRVTLRLQVMRQGRLKNFATYSTCLQGKYGIEIGGPSRIFQNGNLLPIYQEVEGLDNCDFSQSTVWAQHSTAFVFNPQKAPGKTLFCDGAALVDVNDAIYDFVLSSHNLEHFANPVKALKEWQRVLKPNGVLLLVLPYYRRTFDHRRQPTDVNHMFKDFEQNIGEDDLTHLPEILEKHDLDMDPGAGSPEAFRQRSLKNFFNRCLHHHVFDENNSLELLNRAGFQVISIDQALPYHLCVLALNLPLSSAE
jgi:SAM-dependent methyltransferase